MEKNYTNKAIGQPPQSKIIVIDDHFKHALDETDEVGNWTPTGEYTEEAKKADAAERILKEMRERDQRIRDLQGGK